MLAPKPPNPPVDCCWLLEPKPPNPPNDMVGVRVSRYSEEVTDAASYPLVVGCCLCCGEVDASRKRDSRWARFSTGHEQQIKNRRRKRAYAMKRIWTVAEAASIAQAQLRGDESLMEKSRSGELMAVFFSFPRAEPRQRAPPQRRAGRTVNESSARQRKKTRENVDYQSETQEVQRPRAECLFNTSGGKVTLS